MIIMDPTNPWGVRIVVVSDTKPEQRGNEVFVTESYYNEIIKKLIPEEDQDETTK